MSWNIIDHHPFLLMHSFIRLSYTYQHPMPFLATELITLYLTTPYALSGYWINIEFTGTTNYIKYYWITLK